MASGLATIDERRSAWGKPTAPRYGLLASQLQQLIEDRLQVRTREEDPEAPPTSRAGRAGCSALGSACRRT